MLWIKASIKYINVNKISYISLHQCHLEKYSNCRFMSFFSNQTHLRSQVGASQECFCVRLRPDGVSNETEFVLLTVVVWECDVCEATHPRVPFPVASGLTRELRMREGKCCPTLKVTADPWKADGGQKECQSCGGLGQVLLPY